MVPHMFLLLVLLPSTLGFPSPINIPSDVEQLLVPSGRMRYRARIAYDGNGFQGFQFQPHARTIQGEIELALCRRFQRAIRVVGASRTDAGVHARGQAIHFDLMCSDLRQVNHQVPQSEVNSLQIAINSMLRHDLRVYNLQEAPMVYKKVKGVTSDHPWHAGYDAKGKLYIYRISASSVMDPLERHNRYDLSWKKPLNIERFHRTLKHFEGTHDFRAFSGGIDEKERIIESVFDTRRTVYNVNLISEGGGMYRIEVNLQGALYKMIRNMVGTALDVAWGNISEEQFLTLLHAGAKRQVNKSKPAPPEGLTLEHVYYDEY